jgi:hypothetical protein
MAIPLLPCSSPLWIVAPFQLSLLQNQNHSQSYFTTGALLLIRSWRQAPWYSRPGIFFFQLNTCGHSPYVTFSLAIGWACRLQLLLALASAIILRSESRWTHHILLSQTRDSPQTGRPGPRIYSPQEQGCPVIPPGTGFPSRRLLRLSWLRWKYKTPPPRDPTASFCFNCPLSDPFAWTK